MYNDHNTGRRVAPATTADLGDGCAESRLLITRRSFLGVTAALYSSAFLPDFANANTDTDARLLVVILRGGLDGLGVLIPKADAHYISARQTHAIPEESTLSLGADFGLHPALASVHEMFTGGDAAFVPAAGIPVRNRSHFACQDNLENGLPGPAAYSTGWLNRLLGALPNGDSIRMRGGLAIDDAPLILRGLEPVLSWSPTPFAKSDPGNVDRLESLYSAVDPVLGDSLMRGLESDALALGAGASSGDINVLRKGFIGAARLMRAATGPRVAVLSVRGWDMHSSEGTLTGQLNNRLLELDQALADLRSELGEIWAKSVCICVTEFGRSVNINGDHGTDHGIGTTSFLVGGAVQGGFIGDWPGLAPAARYEGDLYPATDLRAVFKSILNQHIGVPQSILDDIVFPGSAGVTLSSKVISGPKRAERLASSFQRPLTMQDVAPIARYRKRLGVY